MELGIPRKLGIPRNSYILLGFLNSQIGTQCISLIILVHLAYGMPPFYVYSRNS